MAGYIAASDLRLALSQPTYMALFDDTNSRNVATVDASPQVALVLKRAHAQIVSWVPSIYQQLPNELPADPPSLLIDAELQVAVIYSYRRHPEYVKTYGAEANGALWKELVEFMQRFQSNEQQIASNDNPPEPAPENESSSYSGNDDPMITQPSNLMSCEAEAIGDW
jgi:hypothetical protein